MTGTRWRRSARRWASPGQRSIGTSGSSCRRSDTLAVMMSPSGSTAGPPGPWSLTSAYAPKRSTTAVLVRAQVPVEKVDQVVPAELGRSGLLRVAVAGPLHLGVGVNRGIGEELVPLPMSAVRQQ